MNGPRRYDSLMIGDCFPEVPARFEVTADMVRAYRAIATGLPENNIPKSVENEWAEPTLAALYIRPAQNALRGPPGGIHAKQSFQFHAPVKAGDVLETILEVKEKYERNGRRYVVSETQTKNQNGTKVTTSKITQIWGKEV